MELNYRLTCEEMQESLLALNWKHEGRNKQILVAVLTVFSLFFLYCYIKKPQQVYFVMMTALGIVFMLYLLYGIPMARARKAKKLTQTKGIYRIRIEDHSIHTYEPEQDTQINHRSIALYSQHMITIRAASGLVFSIPKRILSEKQREEVDKIMQQNQCKRIEIISEKRKE